MSSQPPKDFLALSHGEEWVNFYESFDKLVQDHLSRSSELLRKAMSLPEVADREVAQVRTELEGQLSQTRTELEDQLSHTRTELEGQMAAERQQHQAALNSLKAEISSSHQQAASLARMFGSLLTDLDRLSTTVDSALTVQAEAIAAMPVEAVSSEPEVTTEASAPAEESPEEEVAEASTESTEWSAEAVSEEAGEAESEASEGDALSGESQSEIDLNALAAAEAESSEETSDVESYVDAVDEGETTEASSDESDPFAPHVEPERPRPHWLSVARSNSSH